jgi:DNA-directed RNA polymerase specialized sigma subunit
LSNCAEQVKKLLAQSHALYERKFKGDTDAICILLDLNNAIEHAGLTNRQREALYYVYIEDLTQKDAGERMGVTQQAVKIYADNAVDKLAKVYEEAYELGDCDDIFG